MHRLSYTFEETKLPDKLDITKLAFNCVQNMQALAKRKCKQKLIKKTNFLASLYNLLLAH